MGESEDQLPTPDHLKETSVSMSTTDISQELQKIKKEKGGKGFQVLPEFTKEEIENAKKAAEDSSAAGQSTT